MKLEIDNKIFGVIVTIVSAIFGAYIYLNSIHIENHELAAESDRVYDRLLMSDSTRYAQIAKYYYDVQKERPLTKAEESRLRLAEREQCRIRNILSGQEVESCD